MVEYSSDLVRQLQIRRTRMIFVNIIVILLVVAISASVVISLMVGWNLTHPVKEPIANFPENVGLTYSQIQIDSDGLLLDGWLAPGFEDDQRVVIVAHGYANNRSYDAPALATAVQLQQLGIATILFDFRNSGRSEGDITGVGYFERRDLARVIEYARDEGYTSIGILGLSMGGATALITAPDYPEVKAIATDSAFADLRPYLEENLPLWSNLPATPFNWLILNLMPLVTGIDVDEVRPIKSIQLMQDRAFLFIHANGDARIPSANSQQLADVAGPNAELWLTQGTKHVGSYQSNPELYLDKVVSLMVRNL